MYSKTNYKKMNIEKLIELAQNDDINALEELLRSQQKLIFTTYLYLSNNRNDVADLTQEALLRIAKNIKTLKNPKKFKNWSNQIVTHLYYDEIRKKSKNPETISIDQEENEQTAFSIKNILTDQKCRPYEKCISIELENIIRAEINNLPQQYKITIVLRELLGLSYEEIANFTKTSIGTVKSRISRARIKLQTVLKNYI